MNRFLFFILLASLASASRAGAQSQADSIRFTYTVLRDSGGLIDISARLHNDSKRPAPFYTRTCNGVAYDIVADTSLLRYEPRIKCRASWPVVYVIGAGESRTIHASFRYRRRGTATGFAYRFRLVTGPYTDAEVRKGTVPAHRVLLLPGRLQKDEGKEDDGQ
ncbi:MAG: hypothetical protein EOO11_01200 [Chitinophagaceae bacterium]|nr:MAG: hypothetical protein EOO11_01200 [Chitinophagaceae bacterium]